MRSLVCMLLEKKCDAPTKMDPTDNENVLELNGMIDDGDLWINMI